MRRRPPRMFRPGPRVPDVGALVAHCLGGGYVYWFGSRPLHGGFALSQRLVVAAHDVGRGRVRYAEVTPEYATWAEAGRREGAG